MRAAAVLACLSVAITATTARADPCDLQTAEMVHSTGAQFIRRGPAGDMVFLRHPLASEIAMHCRDRAAVGRGHIGLSAPTPYPPRAFFDLVAKGAALSMGLRPAAVRDAALHCQKVALAGPEDHARVDRPLSDVYCDVVRDGSPKFSVVVYPPRADWSKDDDQSTEAWRAREATSERKR